MTTYTANPDELVLLNDKCIASVSSDIESIKYNAIPSLSLFNKEDMRLTLKDAALETSANGISVRVDQLCSQISDDIVEKYNELTGTITENATAAESQAISAIGDAKKYSDQLCANVTEVTDTLFADAKSELSSTLSTYADSQVKSASDAAKAAYAKYDDFKFEYDNQKHFILLALKNADGSSKELSVDAADFIKNRIIDHIEIKDKNLVLYWKDSTGGLSHTDIPIDQLAKMYTSGDGIDITLSEDGPYVISANETVARVEYVKDIAFTVDALSSRTVPQVDAKVNLVQNYVNELSAPKTGTIDMLSDSIVTLDTHIDDVELSVDAVNGDVVVLKDYVEKLSSDSESKPGIIKTLDDKISTLSTEISGLISIAGHIELEQGKKYNDNTLSGIFAKFNLFEAPTGKTVRDGNAYKVTVKPVDSTLSALSATFFTTESKWPDSKAPIVLADGDYIVIHSHTLRSVTADDLDKNIVIVPAVKPHQLYHLSCEVFSLSDSLSTDIRTLSADLSCEISSRVQALSDTLSTDIQHLSDSLSLDISALSDSISADVRQLSTDVSAISSNFVINFNNISATVDKKVQIDGVSIDVLSVCHIDADEYYDLALSGKLDSHTIYVLSGDYVNAYGQQVKYLAEPTLSSDAATKHYVDIVASCYALSSDVSAIKESLAKQVEDLNDKVGEANKKLEEIV